MIEHPDDGRDRDAGGVGRGNPFDGDYPDRRTDEQRARDRGLVARYVGRLGPLSKSSMPDSPVLLQGRRSTRQDPTVVQFDILRSPDREAVFVVSGEILIRLRGDRGIDEETRALLERHGFTAREKREDCAELQERVVEFVSSEIDSKTLTDVVSQVRAEGYSASYNHITPLARVVKGLGGSEPTTGPGDLVRVQVAAEAIRVAVIDTGIAEEKRTDGWISHDDIQRRGDNIDELDLFPEGGDGKLDFASGHGTFVTAVIQQVWPHADIHVYRAIDSDGVGSEFAVGCAMIRAVREGAQILNLSVGSQTLDDGPPVGLEAALDVISEIERQEGREVLVVAAAGNYGDTRPCWPAAFRRVVAVAGLAADFTPAPDWSSHGVWVDCSTIGEGVVSAYVEGCESNLVDPESPDHFGPNSWAVWTGTSFAAPQVTGAVTRVCQEQGLGPRQALAWLLEQGMPIPNFGKAIKVLPGT